MHNQYGQYGQGYDQAAYQQAMFQQQQAYQQQYGGYGGQQQQQQQYGGGGGGYGGQQYGGYGGQQFAGYDQYGQPMQGYGQPQQKGKGGGGGGYGGGKGGNDKGGGGGKDAIRDAMRGASSGGGGGGGGGRGDEQMTFEEHQAAQAAKKAQQQAQKKAAPQQMTFEEHKAAEAKRKEEKAAAAKAKAAAAANAPQAAAPVQIQQRAPKEEVKAEPAPAPAPAKAPEPAPAAKVEEEAADDWEAEADDPEPAAAAEEPAPKKEEPEPPPPVKAVEEPPKAKEEPAPAPAAEEPEEDEAEEAEARGEEGESSGPKDPDPRPHMNVVFIGHVDAGKSTTCGQILYLSGCVDERTIEKYQKEAKDKNRESWFLAYIMDTSDEEKAKGKTVEVGRAHFETEGKRFTILDAPGHKSYVPNMIGGASQADIGVLIISARKGEFETGFERGGQTREHATLAKTLGVDKLIIAINKMDDPSVEWKEARYDEIVKKLTPFLKQSGFKDKEIMFLPMSGLTGDNILERKKTPDWHKGDTLLKTLDTLEVPPRDSTKPVRIPMLDGYKDMGAVMAIGKVEQGTVTPGMKAVVMPIGHPCKVSNVYINDEDMKYAKCGENVTLKMSGVTEDLLCKGYVLSFQPDPVKVVTKFKCQLKITELSEERPVMTAGYQAVLHVHTCAEECEILKLYDTMNMKDKKKEENPKFVREGSVVTCSIKLARATAVDTFTGVAQLGRFTLRDEGRTIAIGKITELPKEEKEKAAKKEKK